MALHKNKHTDAMIADYKAGDPMRVIAKRYGCSPTNVSHILKRYADPRQIRKSRQQAILDTIFRMKKKGMTYAVIADTLGYAEQSVIDKVVDYRKANANG